MPEGYTAISDGFFSRDQHPGLEDPEGGGEGESSGRWLRPEAIGKRWVSPASAVRTCHEVAQERGIAVVLLATWPP